MATPQELLERLEERFILGEISEETYLDLKSKIETRLSPDGDSSLSGTAAPLYCAGCGTEIEPGTGKSFRCEECGEIFCLKCRVKHPDELVLQLCKGCGGPLVEKLKEEHTEEQRPKEEKRRQEQERKREGERGREEVRSGIITDKETGLEWYIGPDRNTTWGEAKAWVEGLIVDGGGWRMPTKAELMGIYKKWAGDRNMVPTFKKSGWWVWSGDETKSSSSVWSLYVYIGEEIWCGRSYSNYIRAFAVRSRI